MKKLFERLFGKLFVGILFAAIAVAPAKSHASEALLAGLSPDHPVSLCIYLSAGNTDPYARSRELASAIEMEGREKEHIDVVRELTHIPWPRHEYGADPRFSLLGNVVAQYAELGLTDVAIEVAYSITDTEAQSRAFELIAGSQVKSGRSEDAGKLAGVLANEELKNRIRGLILRALLKSGDAKSADSVNHMISDLEMRGNNAVRIAAVYAAQGDIESYRRMMDEVMGASEELAATGDSTMLPWRLLWWDVISHDTYLTTAQRVRLKAGIEATDDHQYRTTALAVLARNFRNAGDTATTIAMLNDAARLLEGTEDDWRYPDNISFVARELMEAGKIEDGLAIIAAMKEESIFGFNRPSIVAYLASHGLFERAKTVADSVSWVSGRSDAYQKIAHALATSGDEAGARELYEFALKLLYTEEDTRFRAWNLGELSGRAYDDGIIDLAGAAMTAALDNLALITAPQDIGTTMSSLAGETGFSPHHIDRAIDIADAMIDREVNQYWTARLIAPLIRSEMFLPSHIDRIIELIEENRWDYNWLELLPEIARKLREAGNNFDAAKSVLNLADRMVVATRLTPDNLDITLSIADEYIACGDTATALFLADSALKNVIWLQSEIYGLDFNYEDIGWHYAKWGFFSKALNSISYIFNPDKIPSAVRRIISAYEDRDDSGEARRNLVITSADRKLMKRIAEKRHDPHWR